jgi:hypothetical protein
MKTTGCRLSMPGCQKLKKGKLRLLMLIRSKRLRVFFWVFFSGHYFLVSFFVQITGKYEKIYMPSKNIVIQALIGRFNVVM